MRFGVFTAATAAALAAAAAALPTSTNHVVHEKRSGSSRWSQKESIKPDPRTKLPVRIGLAEENLHLGHDILMDVSDPASKNYGKHLTAEQVRTDLGSASYLTKNGVDRRAFRTCARVY